MNKKMFHVILLSVISLISGILIYNNTDKLISYKAADNKPQYSNDTYTEIMTPYKNLPENIPYDEEYTAILKNNTIYVYSANGTELYRDSEILTDRFTQNDISVLERDGIIYTSRSELIEMLSYLKS